MCGHDIYKSVCAVRASRDLQYAGCARVPSNPRAEVSRGEGRAERPSLSISRGCQTCPHPLSWYLPSNWSCTQNSGVKTCPSQPGPLFTCNVKVLSPPEPVLTLGHQALPACYSGPGPDGDLSPSGYPEDGKAPAWGSLRNSLLHQPPPAFYTPSQPPQLPPSPVSTGVSGLSVSQALRFRDRVPPVP